MTAPSRRGAILLRRKPGEGAVKRRNQRQRRIAAGLCAKCGRDNDRKDEPPTPNGQKPTQCSACVEGAKRYAVNMDDRERARIAAMLAKPRWW